MKRIITFTALAIFGLSSISMAQQGATMPLKRVKIAKDINASLVCYQEGKVILEISDLSSLNPDSNRGIFTIQVHTHKGARHTLFIGANTSCHITETKKK